MTARMRRGELLSRLVADVETQQDVLVRGVLPVASAAAVGALTCVLLGALLPAAGAIAALGLLLAGALAPALTAWTARRTERRVAGARGAVVARTVELLDGAADLLAFGAADRRHAGLADADSALGMLLRRAALARGLGGGIGVLAIGATSVALTAVGVAAVRAGDLPGPALAVLALTPLALADILAALPDAAIGLLAARPAAARLAALERDHAAVHEPARPADVPVPTALATQDLAVRWPGGDRDVVNAVDLRVGDRRRVALTGPSGSGKSTVVAALMRTLDPSTGRVLADGRDARTLTGDQLRAGVGWCGADAHLFDDTLRANLLLAAPLATDAQLADALGRAQLGTWLAGLPDGLDTLIGNSGQSPAGSGNVSGSPARCSPTGRS